MNVLSNAAHGKDFQAYIAKELQNLKESGLITQIIREFRAAEPGYSNPEQYYAPFMIQLNNRTRWILFSTTSLRTDRIKGQQWDADRLKHVDPTIEKAFLVYPDEIAQKEISCFLKQKEKYDSGYEYSRIDDIISFKALLNLIKDYDNTLLEEVYSSSHKQGQEWDEEGRNFERQIAMILSDDQLLADWKKGEQHDKHYIFYQSYLIFCKILETLPLKRTDVISIHAISDKDSIGLLPSGGSPKTDVIAYVETNSGEKLQFTFSCKRSSKNSVSVHQYTADAFADMIDRDNEELRSLLNMFQVHGNKMNFPQDASIALEKMLSPHLKRFCKWVLGGHEGGGTQAQLAEYIVTFNPINDALSVHATDEYIDLLLKHPKGFFGTPFQWTYASGQRGKSIQLKMPIL